jgi:hypothetical protein
MKIDETIKATKPQLPKGYKLEGLVEGGLMMKLVDPNPNVRPTMEDIRSDWLPRWKDQLSESEGVF